MRKQIFLIFARISALQTVRIKYISFQLYRREDYRETLTGNISHHKIGLESLNLITSKSIDAGNTMVEKDTARSTKAYSLKKK